MTSRLVVSDCLDALREMADGSIDAVVCDPPYGLEFMGKDWDRLTNYAGITQGNGSPHARSHSVNYVGSPNPTCRNCGGLRSLATEGSGGRRKCRCESPDFPNTRTPAMQAQQEWHYAWAVEVYRVLKPGGHLLAFGGTRTYHRLACAIEDAGFEIRDSIHWVYGSGFPKSLDVSKAIDKAAGAERKVVGTKHVTRVLDAETLRRDNYTVGAAASGGEVAVTAPATDDAARWQGWGTALKPAHEPIVVARKPLSGTVAQNVLAHGTGALNIDATRVGFRSEADERESKDKNRHADFGTAPTQNAVYNDFSMVERRNYDPTGRWPANFLLTHAEGCVRVGTATAKASGAYPAQRGEGVATGFGKGQPDPRGPRTSGNGDGTETVAVWQCVEGCPVREMDEQSGKSKSTGGRIGKKAQGSVAIGAAGAYEAGDPGYGDTGGASRFFPTFEPGRWPPNFVLTHAEGCEEVGTADDTFGGGAKATSGFAEGYESGDGFAGRTISVPVWNCVEGCPVREMDAQSGIQKSGVAVNRNRGELKRGVVPVLNSRYAVPIDAGYGDTGGASRFFPAFKYQAKANKKERNAGLDDLPDRRQDEDDHERAGTTNPRNRSQALRKNIHPTVKPVELMRWLCRLVTPPGGVVLDPFTGSGTTGVAAVLEGFDFIGIEREPEYAEIAERRIAHAEGRRRETNPRLF